MKKDKLIVINSAEAVIEPFWDRQLCELNEWKVDGALAKETGDRKPWWAEQPESQYRFDHRNVIATSKKNGLRLKATWCNLAFEWLRKEEGKALSLYRDFALDCGDYDNLVLSCVLPEESRLTLTAQTDKGLKQKTFSPYRGLKKEYKLNLESAGHLGRVTIELETDREGPGFGSFGWLGLESPERLNFHVRQFAGHTPDWYPYLKPRDYRGDFLPRYGFLFSGEELDRLRSRHAKLAVNGESPFLANRAKWNRQPEAMIDDFIMMGADTRYRRERNYAHQLLSHGEEILLAAALTDDPSLLRLAARYALSLAFCANTDDGMITNVRGSNFEHKAFVATQTARALTLILDIAWDWFSPAGRIYVQRRINEDCLGKINARILKYSEEPEKIFTMNQLILFSEGRILGYLALEDHYPRAKAYGDMAFADVEESLSLSIGADGSYAEGPGYFSHIAGKVPQYYYFLSRRRNRDMKSLLPPSLLKTADFAQVLDSTDVNRTLVPLCDTNETNLYPGFLALLANALPESRWSDMYRKHLERSKGRPADFFSFLFMEDPGTGEARKPLIYLEEMKLLASHRMKHGVWTKILTLGGRAGAGHNHEDKGSFIIEFAGDTYAMDPGQCDYHLEAASHFKCCQMHNMLIPAGTRERPAPANPLPADVSPRYSGDETSFLSEIDLTPGWEPFYDEWTRIIDSPEPHVVTIKDTYALNNGEGVEFLWHTPLPATILPGEREGTILIQGRVSRAVLTCPDECRVVIEPLQPTEEISLNRIKIISGKREDTLIVTARFYKESNNGK